MFRAAMQVDQGPLAPSGSVLWCLAKSVEKQVLNRRVEPLWLDLLHYPSNQTPWRFLRKIRANNIQYPQWPHHCPYLCRRGFWSDHLLPIRASGCETACVLLRPWGTHARAANALRVPGTSCAGCQGRRCECCRFRRQTNLLGRAWVSP